jgi:DNA polymerase elongation subunit (family B)
VTIPLVNAFWQGASVVTVARDASGKRVRRAFPADHATFLRVADVTPETIRRIGEWPLVRTLRRDGDWWRIGWRDWVAAREATCRLSRPHPTLGGMETLFERMEIPTFEGDVHPVRRFLADHAVELQRPRCAFLDLETDSRVPFSRKEQARILSWAVVAAEDGDWWGGVLEEDTDRAEHDLLVELWSILDTFDQVAAWNGDRFDFEVLRARTAARGVVAHAPTLLWLDHLSLFRRMNTAAESGDEKQSFALGRVATSVLGETKDDLDGSRTWEYWAAGGAERERLFAYNLRDADLLRLIDRRTGYLDLLWEICRACTTLPDSRGLDGTNYVEGYLMRVGAARGVRWPTRWRGGLDADRDQFEGAYVLEPTRKGILTGVHVADFAGMYPSIIETWNMSPETYREDVVLHDSGFLPSYMLHVPKRNAPIPDGCCAVPQAAVFNVQPPGLLAQAVTDLKGLRKAWTAKKAAATPGTAAWVEADRRATAYKVATNTFYGVIGAPMSRFFVREVAAAVTAAGRWLIRAVITAATDLGWEVVYCDTDSVFVVGPTAARFQEFVAWCNDDLFPRLVAGQRCPRNEIRLAYEKEFARLVLLRKKRYAGRFAHYKGTAATAESKPEVKGLEYKRGDSVRAARDLQLEVVTRILGGDDDVAGYRALIVGWRDRVLGGGLPVEDFAVSKSLSREVEEYRTRLKKDGTATAVPAHVAVAAELGRRGRDVGAGTRVEYVVTDGAATPQKAIPREDYTPGCEDRFYVWEALVWPPTLRVLEVAFPAGRWDEFSSVRPPKQRAVKAAAPASLRPTKGRGGVPGQGALF